MTNNSDLDVGKRVLRIEAEGIAELSESLDGRFTDALNVLSSINGRIVLSGMGKSGHIAQKIAAIFASTGTPAIFVHPAEASHGDLGMITKDPVIMGFNNEDLIIFFKY